MSWQEKLTQSERDQLLDNLNDKQKKFIQEYMKRGRRTVFANVLARGKAGHAADEAVEEIAREWELENYLDAGSEWQTTSKLFCECGRKLRYQYIVQNHRTGEVKLFGINHFEEHTGIPPRLAKEIKNGIERIDFEMDEVLLKISSGWSLEDEGISEIPSSIEIPAAIQGHFDNQVPLLNRQVRRLKERIAAYFREKERIKLEALMREREQKAKRKKEEIIQRRKTIAAEMGWGKKRETVQTIPLEQKLQVAILVYLDDLKQPQFSAGDICKELMENHGASKEKYSSGRPMIFSHVCIFLEHLIRQGTLELVEKQGMEDRVYKLLDVSQKEAETPQYSQGSLFDI